MTPSHASKNGVRYRYYVTDKRTRPDDASVDVWRLRAEEFERAVERILDRWIENRAAATNQLLRPNAPAHIIENVRREVDSASQGVAADGSTTSIYKWAELIDRVEIKPNSIAIELDPRMLVHAPDADSFLKSSVDISASLQLQQHGQERRLVLGDIETERARDPVIAKLLQRAARWKREWFGREVSSLESIAKSDGVLKSDASKQVRLAFLAPDIVEALLDGSAPVDVTAESLRRLDDLPLSWAKQRVLLGFRQTS